MPGAVDFIGAVAQDQPLHLRAGDDLHPLPPGPGHQGLRHVPGAVAGGEDPVAALAMLRHGAPEQGLGWVVAGGDRRGRV